MARRWNEFPKRVLEEFDTSKKAASGASAFIGGIVGGPVGAFVGGAGTSIAFLGYCAYKAWPARLKDATSQVGNIVSIEELKGIHPTLRRVGSIGVSNVGKTTLQSHIASISAPENVRTEHLYARISVLPASPPVIYALIDGAGQQFTQQFNIFDECEFVVICFDHNDVPTSGSADDARLELQREFMQQLLSHMKRTNRVPLRIHFILNKNDSWGGGADAVKLRDWFAQRVTQWQNIPGTSITSAEHSNFVAGDIVKISQLIASWLGE